MFKAHIHFNACQAPQLDRMIGMEWNDLNWTGNGPGMDLDLSLTIKPLTK